MAKPPEVELAKGLRHRQTEAEKKLWSRLRNKQLCGVKFRRQQPVGNYIVDFVSFDKKLIVEVDGGQHNESKKRENDEQRTRWLESNGFRILRFWNNEVLLNMTGVLEQIEQALR
ncbi:MAG: endonuclease domain-containing protein [Dehalococcoidales bacterium]|nr:endonuclease domain-containing protein [Dehalococcoidales bacterium]